MTERPKRIRGLNGIKAMRARGEDWIVLCAHCPHPGGVHVIDQWEPRVSHCRCCAACPGYADGERGVWSDASGEVAQSDVT
jgi:hypothetical protein